MLTRSGWETDLTPPRVRGDPNVAPEALRTSPHETRAFGSELRRPLWRRAVTEPPHPLNEDDEEEGVHAVCEAAAFWSRRSCTGFMGVYVRMPPGGGDARGGGGAAPCVCPDSILPSTT